MNAKKDSAEETITIIIAEDSRTQAEQLQYILEQKRYRVMTAENGKQALALMDECRPTLVITDIIMPEMDGYELCKRIKSNETTQDIPVILLTSLTSSEGVLEGLACGADNFISKPYSDDYLLSNIEKILAGRKLYKSERVRIGVEIMFDGKPRFITADQQQMLSLLISTYEAAVNRNNELTKAQDELRTFNEHLEDLVEKRTAELSKEILERKQAEIALRMSKEYLDNIINFIGSPVFVKDDCFRFTIVNNAFCDMLGIERKDIIGKTLGETLSEDQRDHFLEVDRMVIESGVENQCEELLTGRGGKIFNIVTKKTLYIDERGNKFIVGVIHDVTEHKQAEEEREKLQLQFNQAQKLEAVGQLAGGIAHDFNNLLTVILGYGEIVLSTLNSDDPLRKDLEEIIKAAKRAANLSRQLLAFSRKQTLQPEVFGLNTVVENLKKMLRRLISEDIEFTLSLDNDLGRIKADPGQVEQVIMNLAVNARDAMPAGGKLIIETANVEFDQEQEEKRFSMVPGRYVMLAISDTGCGMDEATRSRLFEPFFTTKEKGKGTGLGLSTVYGIVKQSGGDIRVYSKPGMGTTFKIYFPCTDDEPISRAERAMEEELRVNGEHVLVVEDEPSLRNLVERMLVTLGFRVTVAANSGEALSAVEEKGLRPEFVITDVVMPGMNGIELINLLHKTLPGLKVLFMSGYTEKSVLQQNILDSGTPFIQKPFKRDDLVSKIKKLLRKVPAEVT